MESEQGDTRQQPTEAGSQNSAQPALLPLMPEGVDFSAVQDELAKQTERGAAILAGAYIEWRVRQAIERRLFRWDTVPTGKSKPEPIGARLFGTDDTAGELGFGDQCKMAYCLGLVGPVAYCDLKRIAKIRNRFAHHMEVTSFAGDAKVKVLCDQLETPDVYRATIQRMIEQHNQQPNAGRLGPAIHLNDGTPRARYLLSVQLIWIMVYQVAAYFPVEWPNPEGRILYW